jgi:hypothetical protein
MECLDASQRDSSVKILLGGEDRLGVRQNEVDLSSTSDQSFLAHRQCT